MVIISLSGNPRRPRPYQPRDPRSRRGPPTPSEASSAGAGSSSGGAGSSSGTGSGSSSAVGAGSSSSGGAGTSGGVTLTERARKDLLWHIRRLETHLANQEGVIHHVRQAVDWLNEGIGATGRTLMAMEAELTHTAPSLSAMLEQQVGTGGQGKQESTSTALDEAPDFVFPANDGYHELAFGPNGLSLEEIEDIPEVALYIPEKP